MAVWRRWRRVDRGGGGRVGSNGSGVMAAAAVLSVAEVMALMMAMRLRLRQERRKSGGNRCPSSGNLRRPWVGLAWIRHEKGLQLLESVPSGLNGSPNPDKLACHEVSAGRTRRDLGLIEVAQRTRRRQHQAHLRASLWVACTSVSKALAVLGWARAAASHVFTSHP